MNKLNGLLAALLSFAVAAAPTEAAARNVAAAARAARPVAQGSFRPGAPRTLALPLVATRVSPIAAAPFTGALLAPAAAPAAAHAAAAAAAAAPLALPAALPHAAPAVAALASVPVSRPADRAASLDALFEGGVARRALVEAAPVALAGQSPASAENRPHAAGPRWIENAPEDAQGPRWVENFQAPKAPEPKRSTRRTLSIGLVGAVANIALFSVVTGVAHLLGYVPNPSYELPGLNQIGAVSLVTMAAVMAPLSEEAIFRAGMQGRLSKLTAKLGAGRFWLSAAAVSALFTVIHETSDPLLMAIRFAGALMLGRVYHKEGLLAATAMHAFFNGLIVLPMVLAGAGLGGAAAALQIAAFAATIAAGRHLWKHRAEARAGQVKSAEYSASGARLAAAVLIFGFLAIMGNILWPVGAFALFILGRRLTAAGR